VTAAALARLLQLAIGRVDRASTRPERTIHLLLTIACAMCFIGHGAWGLITKARWLPLYGVFGVAPALAWKTMPLIGAVDITLGLAVLAAPGRALFGYMALWTLFTALLRPIAHLGWWEFFERGGNYGPPIALWALASSQKARWFDRVAPCPLSVDDLRRVAWILRVSIASLLLGHGAFALIQEKAALLAHWQSIGIRADRAFLHALGAAEIGAALAVLLRPSRAVLLGVGYWKIATELLYPVSGGLRDVWEWVERGGDYAAPFALLCVLALLEPGRLPWEK
jgi:hypothetical protein